MRKPSYHVYVTQEVPTGDNGEKKHVLDESRRGFSP